MEGADKGGGEGGGSKGAGPASSGAGAPGVGAPAALPQVYPPPSAPNRRTSVNLGVPGKASSEAGSAASDDRGGKGKGGGPKGPKGSKGQKGQNPPAPRGAKGGGGGREGGGKGAGRRVGKFDPKVELFAHLQQYQESTREGTLRALSEGIHPAVVELGLQYARGNVVGGMARCVAMLAAFRRLVASYETPPGKPFSRDLLKVLRISIDYLNDCRPISVSMGNAIRFLKQQIAAVPLGMEEEEAKEDVLDTIDQFVQDKVVSAGRALVGLAVTKISDGDTVLTFGYSHAVFNLLVQAFEEKKDFRVVAVDARPLHEGRVLVRRLLAKGIACTLVNVSGLSYIMKEATMVFVGAASVCANGTVVARAGTAAVTVMAHAYRVPVMVCCETLKFTERVLLDSITSNELGNPLALTEDSLNQSPKPLQGQKAAQDNLKFLNIMYDATPPDYVTAIVTEVGMLPTSSVSVVLRERGLEGPL